MEVSSSLEIHRPADEVFAFIADAENNPTWQRGMRSCRWVTEPPIEEGSVYEQEAVFLGKTVTSTFEVVDLQPGRSITIQTIASTFPIRVTRSVEPLDDGVSRVSASVRGEPSNVFKVFTPLLRWMVQRAVRSDYRRLRSHLEAPRS